MKQQELVLAFVIALVSALVALGLYLWLFEISTGKLKTSVSRSGARAASVVLGFLRKRTALLVGVLVAAGMIILAARYFDVLSELVRGLLRRGAQPPR